MSVIAEIILGKLSVLEPSYIKLRDDSDKHAGHAGWRKQGETHFTLHISSPKFKNLSKVKCHQLIYNLLAAELRGQIHALSINIVDL